MITNQTPYLGKIRIKFEKHPHYSSGSDKLNKVHLNLGFTKLVSRIKTAGVNPECIELIEKHTGLKVGVHKFGPNNEYTLENSCMTPSGDYVGDIARGWWYYQNKLRSTKGSYPHVAWSKEAKQWVGYSHRAACAFGKGDKLFDESWIPTDSELLELERYYVKRLDDFQKHREMRSVSNDPKHTKPDLTLNQWAVSHIPFKLRGSKTIRTYEEACQAAINFSKYVS